MADDKVKYGNALVTHYLKLWKEKYPGANNRFNRYALKWGFMDVAESVGFERAKEILEYYFRTSRPGHPAQWFLYNFDKLDALMVELDEDDLKKSAVRAATRARVEEWKERNEQLRSKTN